MILFFALSFYYSCNKDKPELFEEKFCLHPFLDAQIKRLNDKLPRDTNFYIKGVFNGVSRTTNY